MSKQTILSPCNKKKKPHYIITLIEKLNNWKEERHISLEASKAGYIRNVFEELGELAEAIKENNLNAQIDAICDIAVFSINASPTIKSNLLEKEFNVLIDDARLNIRNTKDKNLYLLNSINRFSILLSSAKDDYVLASIIPNLFALMVELGYDPVVCMEETFKEINSRTGYFDEGLNKFVKDTSEEAKAKWYRADYDQAKIRGAQCLGYKIE